jgi:polygalacturonase
VNVTISNCSIISPRFSKVIYGRQRGISGISLELVDGGQMDRIAISNVTIDGVEVPLFVRLGNRGTGFRVSEAKPGEERPVGTLRNVSFNNIIATRAGQTGCSVVGLPGHHVENVAFNNVTIHSEGGGKTEWASAAIKELADRYPEATMFGKLPAHGLYCRHVRGLTLTDVRIQTDKPDGRHALVLDDVQRASISNLAGAQPTAAALVRLTQCRNVLIRGCQPEAGESAFLRLEGPDTAGIALLGNDFGNIAQVADFAEGLEPAVLRKEGNLYAAPR